MIFDTLPKNRCVGSLKERALPSLKHGVWKWLRQLHLAVCLKNQQSKTQRLKLRAMRQVDASAEFHYLALKTGIYEVL